MRPLVAPKAQDLAGPPQVDRTTAIRLLTTQLESGLRVLEAQPVTKDHHARWELVTRHHLEKAFGRGSPNILAVVDAGLRSMCPIGVDKKWWEAYRAERLAIQLTELAGMLRLLGAEPELELPKPSRVESSRRTSKAEPKAPTSKSASYPVASAAEPDADTSAELFSNWTSDAPSATQTSSPPTVLDTFTGVACLNGHVITGAVEAYPGRATPRCRTCGSATLRACRECGVELRGGQYSMRLDDRAEPPWAVPNYCHGCGAAYPWTRLKRDAIEATIAELQELEASERDGLLVLVPDTIDETPKTAVAVMRWQRALSKLPPQTRSLASDVLKQAAAPLVAQHLGLTS